MGISLALLPFFILVAFLRDRQGGWRGGILIAAVLWAGYLVCLTEVLSVVNLVTVSGLVCGWIVGALLAIAAVVLQLIPIDGAPIRVAPAQGNRTTRMLAGAVVGIAAVLACVAWIGPPNNCDSMNYHMPRVIHWIQDRNVAFYPTENLFQLEHPPGAEYVILHFQLLSGGDRFANLVQWSAYCGSVIGVSAIAGLLGAGALGQVLAAVVAATLPMACLQALSTQNDMVSAFWLTCLAYFILRTIRLSGAGWGRSAWLMTFLCGAATGLGMVTKTTAYIFAAPLVVGFVAALLVRQRWRAVLPIALAAVVAVTINVPAYARNIRFSHSPIGGGGFGRNGGAPYRNEHLGVRPTAINVLRNAALELAFRPRGISRAVERAVRGLGHVLGLDLDDPGTRAFGADFHLGWVGWCDDGMAPGPLQFILMAVAAVMLWRRPRSAGLAALYVLAILLGYVGFCAYLRWQPYHNRLMLPLMVLGSAYVGLAMERHMSRTLCGIMAGLLLAAIVPVIVKDYEHPLIGDHSVFLHGRDERYLTWHEGFGKECAAIAAQAAAHHCRQVGLIIGADDEEYPLMALLRERLPDVRVEAYPGGPMWTAEQLHTRNHGWEENCKPYLIAKIYGFNAVLVRIVDQ